MDNRLRKALEKRGLPAEATDRDAQDFYHRLSLEDKGRLGVELAGPEVRVPSDGEGLQVREAPAAAEVELTTRSIQWRAETINEEEHSIEATIATENPVEVWDRKRWEVVDEILLMEGAQLPPDVRMLATHDRWSLDSVLGSARNIRRENGAIVARLHFVHGDKEADKAWNKVRQDHLKDTSIGYRVFDSTMIEPGQTATVAGRKFTARNLPLKISAIWKPKEVSLTPIGADEDAKTREQPLHYLRGLTMDPKLREYLESIGLRADGSDEDAERFYKELTGKKKARADEIKAGQRTPEEEIARRDAEAQRRETPPPLPAQGQQRPETPPEDPPVDVAAIARQAVADERARGRQIRELAGDDVPEAIRTQAVEDGWDLARCSREFLTAVRENRGPNGDPNGGPAIHSRSHEGSLSARSLAAGLLIGQGLDPTEHSMHNGQRTPRRSDQLTEQDADGGDRFARLSAVDICRQAAYLDTGRSILDPDEAIRTAVSGATLTSIFTTSAYAKLLEGWQTVGDSTVGWTDEEDVANFLLQDDITLDAQSRLQQLPRGDTAKHATASDSKEQYRIARYAKQFVVDEQDIIDDRLGAIMAMPVEMGEAARRLRPDLVYAIILANPALVADSIAVFEAITHLNLGTAPLGSSSLKAAISAMGKQRLNNNVLNIKPRYLLLPSALEFVGDELLSPAMLAKLFADSSDPVFSTENQIARRNLIPVSDDRLGAGGVVDPRTGVLTPGSDTAWYLAAGGRRSIRVAFRRGTNRQPVMRSFQLDRGQWGIGWDINLDIGACFIDYRGWYSSTGAGD